MPIPPYAKLLVRKNGGPPHSGPITCADGDSIQLAVEQPTAIESYRWEVYGYPPGWSPEGWTLDTASGAFVSTASSPPAFTLSGWGKWMLRLVINGGVTRDVKNSPAVDETTALEIVSPKGLRDLAPGEHTQFGGPASWVKDLQRNLRVIEDELASSTVTAFFVVSHDTDLVRGDVVCLAGSPAPGGERRVTRATAAAMASAGTPVGIVMADAPKGASVRVAIAGVVPATVTGLLAGEPGFVRVNAEGRCVRVSPPGDGDVLLGAVDDAGNLAMAHGRGGNIYSHFVTLEGDADGPSNANTVRAIQGVPVEAGAPTDGHVLTGVGGAWKARPLPAPPVPTAAQIAFDPGATGLPNKVQAAILAVNDKAENPPGGSDAESIQGVPVSPDAPSEGQALVVNGGGIYEPRYVGLSRVVVLNAPGTYHAKAGDVVIVGAGVTGDVDIRLPTAVGISAPVQVKRMSMNAALVTVDGMGATIDGDSAISIKPHEAATFRRFDVNAWARMGKCEAVGGGVVAHLGLEYDPIALWKLDGTLNDYSGNGLHLTTLGSGVYNVPTTGFECVFTDGTATTPGHSGTGISYPELLSPDLTVQVVTLALANTSDATRVLLGVIPSGFSASSAVPKWVLRRSPTSVDFVYRNVANTTDVIVSGTGFTVGEWAHVAATRRIVGGEAIVRIYVNGSKVGEATGLPLPLAAAGHSYHARVGHLQRGLFGSGKTHGFALSDAQVYAEAQKAGRAP